MSLILFIMITITKTASTLPQALDILSAQDEHILTSTLYVVSDLIMSIIRLWLFSFAVFKNLAINNYKIIPNGRSLNKIPCFFYAVKTL